MRFLRYEDLKTRGIPFSRVHIDRLQKAGQFPRKVKLGGNTAAYIEDEIDTWLASRVAARDSTEAASNNP
jgi:prophage regulatory protein